MHVMRERVMHVMRESQLLASIKEGTAVVCARLCCCAAWQPGASPAQSCRVTVLQGAKLSSGHAKETSSAAGNRTFREVQLQEPIR